MESWKKQIAETDGISSLLYRLHKLILLYCVQRLVKGHYVYLHTSYMYILLLTQTHAYTRIHTCIHYTDTLVQTHTHTYTHTHTTHKHVHRHVHTRTHTHTRIHTHAHTHKHTHKHTTHAYIVTHMHT